MRDYFNEMISLVLQRLVTDINVDLFQVQVVMREVCAVITRGTMMDGDIAHMTGERTLMLSLVERTSETGSSLIGLCVVDASTGCFQLCQVL